MRSLSAALEKGELQSVVDHEEAGGKRFSGLEAVPDAIDHLYAGKNVGKVVVDLRSEAEKKQEEVAAKAQQQWMQRVKESKL